MRSGAEPGHGAEGSVYKERSGRGEDPDGECAGVSGREGRGDGRGDRRAGPVRSSATDLPQQTPKYARLFNVVDSFDTHAKIPEHYAAVDAAAKEGGKVH